MRKIIDNSREPDGCEEYISQEGIKKKKEKKGKGERCSHGRIMTEAKMDYSREPGIFSGPDTRRGEGEEGVNSR